MVCSELDQLRPRSNGRSYSELIEFVEDRPGHDRRYSINSQRIETDLGWFPSVTFEQGLKSTVRWYIDNTEEFVSKQSAQESMNNSSERIGLLQYE